MLPQLIVLCGTAFSGKSTLASALHIELGYSIVSADAIHEEQGNLPPFTNDQWAAIHQESLRRTKSLTQAGNRVVMDDTASCRFIRDDFRKLADDLSASMVIVVLQLPVEEVIRRAQMNRELPTRHDVPDSILLPHLENFEWPDDDEDAVWLDAKQIPTLLLAAIKEVLGV